MVAKKDFDVGDLVWAKMKGFPFWPGEIANPPTDAKSSKKVQHYVFFFGTENYAWILDENIVHHSEEMLQAASTKKKSTLLKTAIAEITEKSPKDAKSLVKEKESPEISTSGTKRKVVREQRMKVKAKKVEKKKASKKRALDESANGGSPPPKSSRKTEDFFESSGSSSPETSYRGISVREIEDILPPPPPTTTISSSGMRSRHYYELEPAPPLNLSEPNKKVMSKELELSNKKIGFIGLGMMGQRLVKNLLNTRHNVTVWNRSREKCDDFVEAGALLGQSPADLIEKCDVVFCCVSGPEVSKSVVFRNDGVLQGLERSPSGSKNYVELTTIDADTSTTIANAVIQKGGKYLEAPMIGSRKMAEEGTLFIMAAGCVEVFRACRGCFSALAKTAYFLSPDYGNACRMNLLNSLIKGVSIAGLGEAMALVNRLDLSLSNFLQILELGPMNSDLLADKGKAMLSHYFSTDNTLKYEQNNLFLALTFGNLVEQPLRVTAASNELFKHAKFLRYSDHDVSAVFLSAK